MRRYVTAWEPAGEWTGAKAYGSTTIDVFEREREPSWTGLYDARGVRIMAVDDRPAFGFLREVMR